MFKMQKRTLVLLILLMAAAGFCFPAAASNTYDIRQENVDQVLLFPGDVLIGAGRIQIGEEGEDVITGLEGEWCNNQEVVYRVNVDAQSGSVTLMPFGHTVTIENGISVCDDLYEDTHYEDHQSGSSAEDYFIMEEEDGEEGDLAAYPDGMSVKISAMEGTDGWTFDHWESSDDVILDEPYSSSTSFVMGGENVSLRAVYRQSEEEEDFEQDGLFWDEDADFFTEESSGYDSEEDFSGYDSEDDSDGFDPEEETSPGTGMFDEADQEPLQIEAGWASESDSVFDITGNEEGADSIFDNLDPDALSGQDFGELDEYLEQNGILPDNPAETGADRDNDLSDPATQDWAESGKMSSQTNHVTVDGGSILLNGGEDQTTDWDYPEAEYVTVFTPQREDAVFDHWESDDEDVYFLAGDGERTNWFMMPDHDVSVRAVWSDTFSAPEMMPEDQMPDSALESEETEEKEKRYRIRIISEHVYIYGDVLVNEENEIRAKEGAVVNLQADTLENFDFAYWAITRKSDDSEVPAEDIYSPVTSFIMPKGSVYVSAHYTEKVIETHEVSVRHGTGGGTYAPGDSVILTAQTALEGEKFKQWKVNSGNVTLSDPQAEETSFVMGGEDVCVSATYEYIYYNLKVTSGSGSGTYKKKDKVKLTAQWPADGKEFDTWLVNSANAKVSDPARFATTLNMPADHVSVQALYKDGPSVNDNLISGIDAGAALTRGAAISFCASGAGMENADPNPGDFRWKPSGYRIGSASGLWSDGKYNTSMAINAVGNYTLYVDFIKEVWNGTSWETNKVTDTRSVSFTVTAPTAVETGDDTPILPLVLAGSFSLLVIIGLIFLRMRRK